MAIRSFYYTRVHWLSHDKVLKRKVEFKINYAFLFYENTNVSKLLAFFTDDKQLTIVTKKIFFEKNTQH